MEILNETYNKPVDEQGKVVAPMYATRFQSSLRIGVDGIILAANVELTPSACEATSLEFLKTALRRQIMLEIEQRIFGELK